jgi:signal transduction histidine kinase
MSDELQDALERLLDAGAPPSLAAAARVVQADLQVPWVRVALDLADGPELSAEAGVAPPMGSEPDPETTAEWNGRGRVSIRWRGDAEGLESFSRVDGVARMTLWLGMSGALAETTGGTDSPPRGLVELAGAAAHELNQPLTTLLGTIELARRKLDVDHPVQRHLDAMQGEADRIAATVHRLAHVVRYQTKPYVGSSDIMDLQAASQDGEITDPVPVPMPSTADTEDL